MINILKDGTQNLQRIFNEKYNKLYGFITDLTEEEVEELKYISRKRKKNNKTGFPTGTNDIQSKVL